MEKYLKMSDVFVGKVSIRPNGQICVGDHPILGIVDNFYDYYDPICHAINSHDELVSMNKNLLELIDRAFLSAKNSKSNVSGSVWGESYSQGAIDISSYIKDMADKIKAGGAA